MTIERPRTCFVAIPNEYSSLKNKVFTSILHYGSFTFVDIKEALDGRNNMRDFMPPTKLGDMIIVHWKFFAGGEGSLLRFFRLQQVVGKTVPIVVLRSKTETTLSPREAIESGATDLVFDLVFDDFETLDVLFGLINQLAPSS